MLIAGYGRVSTSRDAQMDSLEHQIEFFSQYAAANQYELYRVYADEGISGKQMKNRAEFLRMIEDAKLHLFDMVVVKDISRFARNTVDLLTAIRELRAAGIEVQFLSNNQTVLGNSEFVITVFGALAQEESASLSKRVKFGKRINAQKGRVPNRVFGYRQIDTFHLEIVEEEAAVIRQIYDMYGRGGCGTRRIAAELNAQGLRTRAGVLWRPTTIRRIIRNPIYCGILETNRTETVDFLTGQRKWNPVEDRFRLERPELQIVPKELWERVQTMLEERTDLFHISGEKVREGHHGRYSSKHLFSSMIRCEECGYSFTRKHWSSRKSGTVYYWVCAGHNNFTSDFCGNGTSLKEESLIQALQSYFRSVVEDKEEFVKCALNSLEGLAPGEDVGGEKANRIAKELDAARRKESRYKEMYANDLISMEELKQVLDSIKRDSAKLQEQYVQSAHLEGHQKERRQKFLKDFGQIEHLLDVSQWTNVELREVVDHISVSLAGEVTIHLKTLSEKLV